MRGSSDPVAVFTVVNLRPRVWAARFGTQVSDPDRFGVGGELRLGKHCVVRRWRWEDIGAAASTTDLPLRHRPSAIS